MLSNEDGVKAIRFLQMIAGIDESEEVALKNWQAMPKQEKEQTERVYRAFSVLVEEWHAKNN